MNQLITDQMVHAAFDWLEENTDRAAHAKAMRVKAEYATKRARAQAFLDAEGTVAEREARAFMSDSVKDAMLAEVEAVEADEKMRGRRDKCSVIIDAWRTEQSNLRTMGRAA